MFRWNDEATALGKAETLVNCASSRWSLTNAEVGGLDSSSLKSLLPIVVPCSSLEPSQNQCACSFNSRIRSWDSSVDLVLFLLVSFCSSYIYIRYKFLTAFFCVTPSNSLSTQFFSRWDWYDSTEWNDFQSSLACYHSSCVKLIFWRSWYSMASGPDHKFGAVILSLFYFCNLLNIVL